MKAYGGRLQHAVSGLPPFYAGVRYIRIVTEEFDTTRFEEKLLASCLWLGAFRLVEGRSFSFSYLHESYRIQRVVPPPEIAWKWPRVKVNKSELSIGTWGETVF